MKYNPEIHHRQSVRLNGYDYSQAGYYFITVCAQERECLFGKIENDLMILNDAGKMIGHWWNELKNKFQIELDQYVIMPNHFHGIINIVGADLRVCPDNESNIQLGEHTGSPLQGPSINKIIQWFKTMTTNDYIHNVKQNHWKSFNGKLWQRNYYEHIIRDEKSLWHIREYVANNPCQWRQDELFTD
jgi:REP element-mobilizing transposase RayT